MSQEPRPFGLLQWDLQMISQCTRVLTDLKVDFHERGHFSGALQGGIIQYPCCPLLPVFLAEQYIIMAVSLVSSAANRNGFREQGYSNRRRENKRRLTLTIVKGTITALGTVVTLQHY
ncbi:hypothetical protein JEQ12_009629 [Ovis aries]|uniref:Uncharacterized protein n=1 Tax=Ovis aries TaxID=9940 RepID=A0A836AMY0_SHEEP|nr:hypothetical protein JEQ12_009629 [Ovis aries]